MSSSKEWGGGDSCIVRVHQFLTHGNRERDSFGNGRQDINVADQNEIVNRAGIADDKFHELTGS